MKETKSIGKFPVNSQIFINHTKSPPSIEFGYPDKDTSIVRKSSVTYLISIFFTILLLSFFLILYLLYLQPVTYPHMSAGYTEINDVQVLPIYTFVNGSHYGFDEMRINYTWNDKEYMSKFELSNAGVITLFPYMRENSNQEFKRNIAVLSEASILLLVFIFLVYLNSFWIAKIFKDSKWGNKKFPELNKKLLNERYSVEYTKENFPEKVKGKYIIEIPLFKNIYMDYDAEDDFAEQLQKVSITEHPFALLVKRGLPFSKKRKHMIKKPNVYLWKCLFEFKKKPKNGKMEVRFTTWFILFLGILLIIY